MVSVTEQVLTDPALSTPVVLHHYDGTRTPTRGRFRVLPQTPGELRGAFSRSGPNVWVSSPENSSEVELVEVAGRTWRALDAEEVGLPFDPMIGASTRYQLVGPVDIPQ